MEGGATVEGEEEAEGGLWGKERFKPLLPAAEAWG